MTILRNMVHISCILGLSVLLFLSPGLVAQTTDDGTIISNVHDTSGALIPNATVSIQSDSTGIVVKAVGGTTGSSAGTYTSPPVRPGAYTVKVDAPGFKIEISHVLIEVHQTAAIDFALQIGSTAQTVEVQESTPMLDPESVTVGSVQNEQAVENLPLNTRNFNQLISLTTGTVPGNTQLTGNLPITATRGTVASQVDGIGFRSNNYRVDGLDDTEDHNDQGILLYPPVEAIQEFQVQTSDPSAEFGHGGATISVVYKSGGKQFHGDVFEFLRNAEYFDAKNYFDTTGAIPPFHYNDYGVTFGGPVILLHYNHNRDKTFFFFSWEGVRKSQSLTYLTTVPLTAYQTGNFSSYPYQIYNPLTTTVSGTGVISRQPFSGNQITAPLNSTGVNLLKLFPAPNLPGLVNNYFYAPAATDQRDDFDLKIDENFTARDVAFFRISHQDAALYTPGSLPAPAIGNGQGTTSKYPLYQFASGYTRTLTPNLINEFRAGFTRLNTLALNGNYGNDVSQQVGIPGVNQSNQILTSGLTEIVLSGYDTLGDSGYYPAIIADNNFQVNDSVSWLHGKHAFKFGGEIERRQENVYQTSNLHGDINFGPVYTTDPAAGGVTGNSLADMLLGAYETANIAYVPGVVGKRRTDIGMFAQDAWRPTTKLTVNLGLRWDAWPQFPWVEVENRMAYFVPSLGAVYNVNTSQIPWRSGVQPRYADFSPRIGLAYSVTKTTILRTAYGLYYSPDIGEDAGYENPPFVGSVVYNNTSTNFTGATTVSEGFTRPVGNNFPTLGAAVYAINPHLKTPKASQFNLGVEQSLPSQILLTISYVGTIGRSLLMEPDINQPTPGPGTVTSREPWPNYAALTEVYGPNSSNYNALQVTGQKRMQKNLQFLAAYTWSHALDYGDFVSGVQNINDWRDEYENSVYNLANRFTLSGIYVLPVGRGEFIGSNMSNLANSFLGGWKLSTITNFFSGLPFTPNSSTDTLNDGGAVTQRANRLGSGVLSGSKRSIHEWFNIADFAIPAQYQFGTARKDILTGPPTRMADVSLSKAFTLRPDSPRDLELRIDAFNISNTPQFNNPNASIGSLNAGIISSAGSPSTFQRTSRELQISAKVHF